MALGRILNLQNKTKWKNQYNIIASSKFHTDVRDIFREDPFFSKLQCYQEVPVSDLVPGYSSKRHRVDWFIDEFYLVIELHGKQHYDIANYGNDSFFNAKKNFHNISYRDNLKKTALLDAGYEYIEISYKDKKKLTGDFIKSKIFT